METYKLYIDGQWVDSASNDFLEVENPNTREIIARVPRSNVTDVDRAVAAAKRAFATWQFVPVAERVALVQKVLDGLKDGRDKLVRTISMELGCPVKIAAGMHTDPFMLEIAHFIDVAANFPYEKRRETSIVRREPVGVVAGLTPWNFPLEQIEKKAIPALLAGNCVVLKPSQFTPLTAYILAEEIDRAGFPGGVFNLVTGRGGEVGDALARHPDVDMLSFTGSTAAGREVGRLALSNIKKLALELGGKSAAVLIEGGDWALGIQATLDTCILNGGQTCNATTRLIVPRSGLARAEEIIKSTIAAYKVGDLSDPDVDLGPLSSIKQYERVKEYIGIGIAEGARLVTGGLPADDGSYYVAPTVFSDVRNDMRIAQEEIFGPVLVVIPYDTLDEAVDIANDSIYGLGGAVFGPEVEANAVARRIRTGSIYVNSGQWEPNSPFGGYKQSGIGREGGVEGYEEFLEIKTIYDR